MSDKNFPVEILLKLFKKCDHPEIHQIHRHSKTCCKYRNEKCRFHFGKFFTNKNIIAQPLADSVPLDFKLQKMQ